MHAGEGVFGSLKAACSLHHEVRHIAIAVLYICANAGHDAETLLLRANLLLEACLSACSQLYQARRAIHLERGSARILMYCVGGISDAMRLAHSSPQHVR